MKARCGIAICVLLLSLPWAVSCRQRPATQVEPPSKPNLIVLMIDTLRADHMSLYGYGRPTTPELAAMAGDLVIFDRARSQAACTFPSVNAFMTSRHASFFLFQPDHSFGIPASSPALAELLQRAGFATAAVSASPIVRATPSSSNPFGGFGRGFDSFDELHHLTDAEEINRRGLAYAAELPQPFFLYLHYMDPHDPYGPPAGFETSFGEPYQGIEWIADGNPNPIADMLYDNGPEVTPSAADIAHLVDLYDAEVAYVDQQMRRLVDGLETLGLLDDSIIVLTADHGEEFMEHGHIKHCHALYEASTRVPLLLHVPGVAGGRRVAQAVQSIDVMPTLLELLGVPAPAQPIQGVSLLPLVEGRPLPERPAFSNQGKWRSADDGRHKLLLDAKEGVPELFDLAADPGEEVDLWSEQHPAGEALGVAIREWLTANEGSVGNQKALDIGKEREEQLRALGYLQ